MKLVREGGARLYVAGDCLHVKEQRQQGSCSLVPEAC